MTRYFFHLRHDAELIEDPDGEEFASREAALAEARHAAGELVVNAIRTGRTVDRDGIEVRDEEGALVGIVRLVEALPIRGASTLHLE